MCYHANTLDIKVILCKLNFQATLHEFILRSPLFLSLIHCARSCEMDARIFAFTILYWLFYLGAICFLVMQLWNTNCFCIFTNAKQQQQSTPNDGCAYQRWMDKNQIATAKIIFAVFFSTRIAHWFQRSFEKWRRFLCTFSTFSPLDWMAFTECDGKKFKWKIITIIIMIKRNDTNCTRRHRLHQWNREIIMRRVLTWVHLSFFVLVIRFDKKKVKTATNDEITRTSNCVIFFLAPVVAMQFFCNVVLFQH